MTNKDKLEFEYERINTTTENPANLIIELTKRGKQGWEIIYYNEDVRSYQQSSGVNKNNYLITAVLKKATINKRQNKSIL